MTATVRGDLPRPGKRAVAVIPETWQRVTMFKLLRILFWSAALLAFVMAVLPQPPQMPGAPSDKVQHILAFTCLALLGWAAYPKLGILKLILGLSAFGALIELVQLIPSLNRDAEPLDWLADTTAVVAVVLALLIWRRMRARHGATG